MTETCDVGRLRHNLMEGISRKQVSFVVYKCERQKNFKGATRQNQILKLRKHTGTDGHGLRPSSTRNSFTTDPWSSMTDIVRS